MITSSNLHDSTYQRKGVGSAKDQQPVPALPADLRKKFMRAENAKAMAQSAITRTRLEWKAEDSLTALSTGAITPEEFKIIGLELQELAAELGLRLKRGAPPDEARVVAVGLHVPAHGPGPGYWIFERSTTGISQPSLFEATGVAS